MRFQLLALSCAFVSTATAAAVSSPDGKPSSPPSPKPSESPKDIEIVCTAGYKYCGSTLINNNNYPVATLKQALVDAGILPTDDTIFTSLFACSSSSGDIDFDTLCPNGCKRKVLGNDHCNDPK